jgi:SOS response regulatory protein OraA/RecX
MSPVVTAVRADGKGAVDIMLDGAPWRSFPHEAVLRAGVRVGVELDRPRARTLRQESKRLAALAAATRALRYRDRSATALEGRLAQAGVAPAERRRALEVLENAGIVDDRRVGAGRAQSLAERGAGDLLILHDLDAHGIARELAEELVAALEPERSRAAAIVTRRGDGAKTARYLAQKGFSEDSIVAVVADADAESLG